MIILVVCSCTRNKQLHYALQAAGENKQELESVLKHFKDDPQKRNATNFLIENMSGHTGASYSNIEKLSSTYQKYIEISQKHNWSRSSEWEKEINAFWAKEKEIIGLPPVKQQDIQTIKADWLINEIDRSFKAWQENAYTKNDSFEDFCRYILPYRFAEGLCLDNSRDVFYNRHAHIFNDPNKDFRAVTDSLHQLYSYLMHNNWAAASMPIFNAATFEQVKRGSCDNKAWYNCLMMSALGMGVTIDFVPAWGNRSGGHSWNSLIINGETHPFEPFWDNDRWKYKRIYNNECFDLNWGKFRLPKVYRRTFEHHFNGPLTDQSVSRDDIPSLFKNPFMTDVSTQYFNAVDVEVYITETIPENAAYCYLCVFGSKEWIPVQWGKIKRNKKVVFKEMGKDIVYLPMFYRNGSLSPAASAFILKEDGSQEQLMAGQKKISVSVQNYTSYLYPQDIAEAKETLVGSYLIGHKELNSIEGDTLYFMTDSMDAWENNISLSNHKKYKYIQFIPPKNVVALCEIAFFGQENKNTPIKDIRVSADITSFTATESLERIVDNLSASGFKGIFKNDNDRKKGIWFDLGKECSIYGFSFIPFTKNYLPEGREQELCYWDNQWISAGILMGHGGVLTFKDIPEGTLYRLRKQGWNDRIFTYKEGIIRWY